MSGYGWRATTSQVDDPKACIPAVVRCFCCAATCYCSVLSFFRPVRERLASLYLCITSRHRVAAMPLSCFSFVFSSANGFII